MKRRKSGNTGRADRSTGYQNINKQRAGHQGLFTDPYFYLFIRLLSAFFSVKMQTKQDLTVLQ